MSGRTKQGAADGPRRTRAGVPSEILRSNPRRGAGPRLLGAATVGGGADLGTVADPV